MNIYRYIREAQVARAGGVPTIPAPRRHYQQRRLQNLERCYAALFRFAIPHPDSKRTPRAKAEARARKQREAIRFHAGQLPELATVWTPRVSHGWD